ncbi:hypothetical protein F5Y11DRAFT_333334 [Daldinia sp. FL1419]|nr:hypothetical protein F5Y11DRAFT_333334 [Daldinia sp. FL1419]
MNIFYNIKKDISLRNATVYAQWLGILSAISFILTRVYWLLAYKHPHPRIYETVVRLFDMIFFPACLFLMEMPPSSRRWRLTFQASMFWCWARTMVDFALSTSGFFHRDGPAGLFMFFGTFIGLALYFTISSTMLLRGEVEDFYSCRTRTLFYAAYTFSLVTGGRGKPVDPPYVCPISPFWFLNPGDALALGWWFGASKCVELAEIFSVLAALMYFVAYWIGHEYVFTRTLGGPGVELMPRITSELAPQDESIGQEEGRIMLP